MVFSLYSSLGFMCSVNVLYVIQLYLKFLIAKANQIIKVITYPSCLQKLYRAIGPGKGILPLIVHYGQCGPCKSQRIIIKMLK